MKHVLYFMKEIHKFSGKILYLNLIGMILISLFEGVGIFLLIPLIGLTGILNVGTSKTGPIAWLYGIFQEIPETIGLSLILGMYLLLIIGQSIFQRNQMILSVRIQQGFIHHLREEMYKVLLYANWGFFLKNRKSNIINLITTEMNRVGGGIALFLQFVSSLVFTLIQIGLSFWLSPEITIFVLIFGILLVFSSKALIKKSTFLGAETVRLFETFFGGITDHLNGIKEIKSNTLEETHVNWFSSISGKLESNIIEIMKVKSTSQLIYKVVSAFLIVFFLFFSIRMLKANPAELMLIIVIFSRIWPRFSGIQSNIEQLASIIPSFKALIDLQHECIKAKELMNEDNLNRATIRLDQCIGCQNVSFRYDQNQPLYALKDISLEIPSKQMTAIVGSSGAGKSTLIDILMGLNTPETGQVLIDGVLLDSDNLLAFRKSISYVPQDPFLFHTTIRENLLLVDPSASEGELWEALEFSSAAEFVSQLPKGLDTILGDRGIRLSGGERQRIVLARAILRQPSILVLDEATSALDTENERKIQEAIEKLKGSMTIIVIAHRLSTIRNADQVIVLDEGKVIQKGGFTQLANEKKGVFSHLLRNQMEIPI